MLGLYLTLSCNKACPYCFKDNVKGTAISEEDFAIFCAWIQRHNPRRIHVAGGEPTTHPHFVPFMQKLRWEGRCVTQVISNLLCEEAQLEGFHHLDVLANTSPPHNDRERQLFEHNLERVVAAPSTRVTLSHTLYDLEQEDRHIVRYCKDLGIRRVRLDFARASLLRQNSRHITLETVALFKEKLVSLAKELASMRVIVGIDCPVPKGLFTEEDLREMNPERATLIDPVHSSCCLVYVNPDLSISSCPFRVIDERRLDVFPDVSTLFATVALAVRKKEAEGKKGPFLCPAERFL